LNRRAVYLAYIASPTWRAKRRMALAAAGYRCNQCQVKQPRGLHVHHRTYKRLGAELLSDLEVLCSDCHHKRHPRWQAVEQQQAVVKAPRKKKRKKRSVASKRPKHISKKRAALSRENEALHRAQAKRGRA
jgi:5-methylcytosine-specific restriction endonuclease McrA